MTADENRRVVPAEFFDALLEDAPSVPNEPTRKAMRQLRRQAKREEAAYATKGGHMSANVTVSEMLANGFPEVLLRLGVGVKAADEHIDYTWGESVTWTYPDRITIPLNRGGRYVADLVLGAEETSVLIDMLADAANPENRQAYDRRRTIWTDWDAHDRDQATDMPPEDESQIAAWYAAKYLKCASCGTPESVKPTVFRLPNGGGDLCAECAKPVIDSTRAIEEAIARKNEKAPAIREPEAGEQ